MRGKETPPVLSTTLVTKSSSSAADSATGKSSSNKPACGSVRSCACVRACVCRATRAHDITEGETWTSSQRLQQDPDSDSQDETHECDLPSKTTSQLIHLRF